MAVGRVWVRVTPLALLPVDCSADGRMSNEKTHGIRTVSSGQDTKADHGTTIASQEASDPNALRSGHEGEEPRQEEADAHVRDGHIVVLAPKEWRRTECATDAEHRTRYRLSLALRHHPVFDSRLFAGNGFRIPRQIARRKNIGSARSQHFGDVPKRVGITDIGVGRTLTMGKDSAIAIYNPNGNLGPADINRSDHGFSLSSEYLPSMKSHR